MVCFSPRHDLTLGRMAPEAVRRVIDVWAEQTAELGAEYRWVQVFENRGEAMGASNPHPHGQIWAGTALPGEAAREDAAQRGPPGRDRQARCCSTTSTRRSGGQRVIVETDEWLVVVPFWAAWPFETLLVPKRPAARLTDLDDASRDDLAVVLHELIGRYDGLFKRPFPYSMGWHQAPFGDGPTDHWQVHAHFYPPLLRANVRKFMVGYELLAETQRDLTAEDAAGPPARGQGGGRRGAGGAEAPRRRPATLTIAGPTPSTRSPAHRRRREPRSGPSGEAAACRRPGIDGLLELTQPDPAPGSMGTSRRRHDADLGRAVQRRDGCARGGLHPLDRGRRRPRR